MIGPKTADERAFFETVEKLRGIGYGRMMQMISEVWRRSSPDDALSVGDTYFMLEKKRERCKKEGHDIRHGQNWDWCDRCVARINPDTGKEACDTE
jgi:hypothetical protein